MKETFRWAFFCDRFPVDSLLYPNKNKICFVFCRLKVFLYTYQSQFVDYNVVCVIPLLLSLLLACNEGSFFFAHHTLPAGLLYDNIQSASLFKHLKLERYKSANFSFLFHSVLMPSLIVEIFFSKDEAASRASNSRHALAKKKRKIITKMIYVCYKR